MFRRDRAGQRCRCASGLAIWLVILFLPRLGIAASKNYEAQRFDIQMTVERGGDLLVTETVTFDFSTGPFTRIWRVIPSQRTDGIDVLNATMDGNPCPLGDGPGHISVSGENRVRVEWHFTPVTTSTHTFGLTYRARGVSVPTNAGDLVDWKPLPTDHPYRIARSSVTITAPVAAEDARIVDLRGIDGGSSIEAGDGSTTAEFERIRSNGSVTLSLRFPRGELAANQPRWRQLADRQAAAAPRWAMAAGAVLLAAIVLVLGMRQGYGPPTVPPIEHSVAEVPQPIPPALSAALVGNGRPPAAAAMATLLDLADRGVIGIQELPRHFGIRNFELTQVAGTHNLAEHEAAALTMAFGGGGDPVRLSKARGRLVRGGRQFRFAVLAELMALGMLSDERLRAASRLKATGIGLLLGGAVLAIPAALLINRYAQWPLLVPLAMVVGGLAGIIAGATTVVLSEHGMISAARWRGYRQALKNIAADRQPTQPTFEPSRALVYAVALGLAPQWSRYLKRQPTAVPPWFAAIGQDPSDAAASFAWFVSSGGSGGSGAASAGAAGGGASGAA